MQRALAMRVPWKRKSGDASSVELQREYRKYLNYNDISKIFGVNRILLHGDNREVKAP